MSSIDFNKLIHSVTYYLSYQDRIGRDFMITESSLKYPVADYLTGLEIPLSCIQIEYPHPSLKKRQIDLVTTGSTKPEIKNAFEFKIAKPETRYDPEQKRIFNDLMRLYLIGKSTGSSSYFFIAGKYIDFIQHFRSIITQKPTGLRKDLPEPQGFYNEWFSFEINEEKTFDVKNASAPDYKQVYSAFLSDYEPAKAQPATLELPDKLKTTCIAISALSREFPTPYVGAIWKVE